MEWWQIQELLITMAVIVGVLVPVFAFSYRLLVRPARRERNRLPGGDDGAAEAFREVRLDSIERQLEELDASVRRLVEVAEFERQLKSGKAEE